MGRGRGSAQVGEDAAGGVVAGRADDAARRVAAGAAGYSPSIRWRRAAGRRSAKVLSTWWMCPPVMPKCASIPGGGSGKVSTTRSLVPGANRSQIDRRCRRSRALRLPGRAGQLVRHPLHEERRVVVPVGVAQRRVDGGVHVPLDGRELAGSRPACTSAHIAAARSSATVRHADRRRGSRWMVEPNWPRSSGRQVKRGSPVSARFTLKVVPVRRTAVHPASSARREARRRATGPSAGTGRRADHHPGARPPGRRPARTPLDRAAADGDACTGVPVTDVRAGGARGLGESA